MLPIAFVLLVLMPGDPASGEPDIWTIVSVAPSLKYCMNSIDDIDKEQYPSFKEAKCVRYVVPGFKMFENYTGDKPKGWPGKPAKL